MKYTPRDITYQTFPSRWGGFEKNAVQHFLNEVASELEKLLQEHQAQQQQIARLSQELQEKTEQEEEIRRVVVAAERIAHDMKENAIRESELILAQAHTQGQELQRQHDVRTANLEKDHLERTKLLEIAFRSRFQDLEREQHELTLAREREYAERTAQLEKQFSDRYVEMTTRLSAARHEYTQFLNGYRALVGTFADLSSRHTLPEEQEARLPPLSQFQNGTTHQRGPKDKPKTIEPLLADQSFV